MGRAIAQLYPLLLALHIAETPCDPIHPITEEQGF